MSTEFLTVHDAKEAGLIPGPWHPYFSEKCVYCGQDMVINFARTVMKCNSTKCYRRVANQADALLKDLGYKGWGPETLTDYCRMTHISSISEFIKEPPLPLNLINDLNSRNLSFAKLVELMHIPNVGTKAHKLFSSYNSWSECLIDVTGVEDFVGFVADKVGGRETGAQVLNTLLDYSDDLAEITKYITIAPPMDGIINIAITGHITEMTYNGRGLTKDEYIAELNALGRECNVEFRQSGALQSVMYIVADTPSNSRKYRIGAARGVLIDSGTLYKTVQEFVNSLGGNTNE